MSNTVGFRWCAAIKSAIHSTGNHRENDHLESRRHTLRYDRCLAASMSSVTFPSHVSMCPPSFPPCATSVLLSICRLTEPRGLLYSDITQPNVLSSLVGCNNRLETVWLVHDLSIWSSRAFSVLLDIHFALPLVPDNVSSVLINSAVHSQRIGCMDLPPLCVKSRYAPFLVDSKTNPSKGQSKGDYSYSRSSKSSSVTFHTDVVVSSVFTSSLSFFCLGRLCTVMVFFSSSLYYNSAILQCTLLDHTVSS